jgi:hypothetical protein
MARQMGRLLLEFIALAFAIVILFPHLQHIWGQRNTIGLREAIVLEFQGAMEPMLGSIIIISILAVVWWRSVKDVGKRELYREKLLEAIALKLGVDIEAIKSEVEEECQWHKGRHKPSEGKR